MFRFQPEAESANLTEWLVSKMIPPDEKAALIHGVDGILLIHDTY